ncbi:hypothetical protein BRCON_0920 [Candidatus Sumerlaea chitinivorans]|uniref:Tetratricopeptide repeat protein n=1 Tax=Sumerlaea chitinivorans TaxID=2250252 RepID=A0A2Z4Y3A7_SUMC1|nr:hypothetical protein BRCON_0920 [Candidatus Sumerlaea chitinivorans]
MRSRVRHMRLCAGFSGVVLVALLWALGVGNASLWADTVTLRSGRLITGTVNRQSPTHLHVATPAGTIGIPLNQVASVEIQTPTTYSAELALAYLSRGQIQAALQVLAELERTADRNILDSALEKWFRTPQYSTVLSDKEWATLEDYLWTRTEAPPPSLVAACVAFCLQSNDLDRAYRVFTKRQPQVANQGTEYNTLRTVSETLLTRLLENDRVTSAITVAKILGRLQGPEAEEQRVTFAVIEEAIRQAEQADHAAALRYLFAHKDAIPLSFAYRTTKQILVSALSSAATSAPLEAFQNAVAYFADPTFHQDLEPLYRSYAEFLLERNAFDSATSLAKIVEPLLPDLAAELLLETEYAHRRNQLAPTDSVGRYKLACWALEMGLTGRGERELEVLTRDPFVGENARLRLKSIWLERDRQALQRAQEAFESGNFRLAYELANKFAVTRSDSELTSSACALAELARFYAEQQPQRQTAEAMARYQEAERLFFRQQYSEALDLVVSIQVEFPNSEVGRRAARLRQEIERKLKVK